MATETQMKPEVENKSFSTRLWELPVAMAAVAQLSNIYSVVKERNTLTKMACNAGESTIQMANAATKPFIEAATSFSLSKPIVGKVECAAATIDHVASETLAKMEEKCPIITKTPEQIKNAVTSKATHCYEAVQGNSVVKMVMSKTEDMLSFGELIVELVLPTDGNCKDDMKELEFAEQEMEKGALARTKNLTHRLKRRSKKAIMSYKPVKFTVGMASTVHERLTDLLGKPSKTGRKVFDAYMYIPNMALKLSGEVIVSAKNFVFALNKSYPVGDMPASVMNMTLKVIQPLSAAKDKLVGHIFVPPQVMTDYILSSRPIQWIVPKIVAVEDLSNMEVTMEEIEYSTDSEDSEEIEDGEGDTN